MLSRNQFFIKEGQEDNTSVKALLLAAGIAIDTVYKEKG